MWTKVTVDEAMKSYPADKARAQHLAVEIEEMQRKIDAAVKGLVYDETGPGAQVITGMPHGTKTGNPTEEVALRLASGWVPDEIKEMRAELMAKQVEHDKHLSRVKYVDAWTSALSEREYWIVLHQCIQQEYWRDILTDYGRTFGGYVTKDTLKGLRAKAMKQIYSAAGIRN